MAYAFESQLVIDPVSGDKAASASVTVYDANDTANSAPLVLTDLNGNPLSNPLTSTQEAFIPPFMAETYKVKLVGGGLTVVAWSGEGLVTEAKAAKDFVAGIDVADTVTAPVGTPAAVTLDKSTGKFSFNIPQGPKGDKGDRGPVGPGAVPLVEDPSDPGTFNYGTGLKEDPSDAGTYLIGA